MRSKKFTTAIEKIKSLEKEERYPGAFIFGSVARSEETDMSDLDVQIVIDTDSCKNINHPFVNGIKCDMTFLSFSQLEEAMDKQALRGERIPMLAESVIIFDKTGKLRELKKRYQKIKPKKYTKKEYQLVRFGIFHANHKIETHFKTDRALALLEMHIGLSDLIKTHYQIHGRWYVGSKRLLYDLGMWDKKCATLVTKYVSEKDDIKKYKLWSQIVHHVLVPIGGMQEVKENNCDCKECKKDLKNLIDF